MPRIKQYKKEYLLTDLSDYIRNEMKHQGISQMTMAHQLGMDQSYFSVKLNKKKFSVDQIVTIFQVLGTSEEKIGRMLKL